MVLHSDELIARFQIDEAGAKQNEINIKVCKNFIERFMIERKTINKRASSYTLKHSVELVHECLGIPTYVTAKQFRQAAKELGFRMSRDYRFNMDCSRLKAFMEKQNIQEACLL